MLYLQIEKLSFFRQISPNWLKYFCRKIFPFYSSSNGLVCHRRYAKQSNLKEHMLNCRRQRQHWLDKFCKLCFYYARENANLSRHEGSSICWKRRQRFLAQTESCYDDVKKYLCGSWSIDTFAENFPNVVGTSLEIEVAIAINSSKRKRRGTLSSSQSQIRGVEHPDIPTSSRHACGYSESVAASEPGPSYVPTIPTESETTEPGPSSSSSTVAPSRVSGSRNWKSKPQKRIPEKRQFTIESRTPSPQLSRMEIDQAPVI